MSRNKRLAVAVLLAIVIAVVFWSQSRIPALNEKAQMGLRTSITAIAFDTVVPVNAAEPLIVRILKSSLNWAYTNWRGMTFGLLFAAAALTILGSVRRRSFASPWLNTLSGVLAGAPLGVCVNCATPIAQGLFAAGARLETALATLMSSPTLNVIVLTMSFTLLPWELAATKLVGVLLMLLTIPFFVRRFATGIDLRAAGKVATEAARRDLPSASKTAQVHLESSESIGQATAAVAKEYVSHLWYIIKLALPLMLLAGVIGATVVELVPFDRFAQARASLPLLLGTALVATVLPVPIAFDVVIVMALVTNGIDAGLATVLLFGLGIYSIYPALVIARYVSVRLSLALGAAVAIVACGLGVGAQAYFEREAQGERRIIAQGLTQGAEAAQLAAIDTCDALPTELHVPCMSAALEALNGIVSDARACAALPSGIDTRGCSMMVAARSAEQRALASDSVAPCESLGARAAQCVYVVTTRRAVANRSIDACNTLPANAAIGACRAQYLNARLLFNPHESACAGLVGPELTDCRTNADIYAFADASNLGACENLSEAAREHCRYVVATAIIGRGGDASGCARLSTPELRGRCDSTATAWRAEREIALELCDSIDSGDLRASCQLRVAGKQIEAAVSRHTLQLARGDAGTAEASSAGVSAAAPDLSAPTVEWTIIRNDGVVEIARAPFANDKQTTGRFERIDAASLGLTRSWNFRATDFFEPFIIGKGIASGDFNGDLWPDVALATERGVAIYQNVGGRFELIEVNQGELTRANVFLVAFVDANNDGWQDLFASAYGGRNHLVLNLDGRFRRTDHLVFEGGQLVTLSAGFGDLDRNGELDIVLGNWSNGSEKLFTAERSANRILYATGGSYRAQTLDEVLGETNSILVADINGDMLADVLVGNDWNAPDVYYLGRAEGGLTRITQGPERGPEHVPLTTMFTMSLDLADFNNDLRADLFATDMTFADSPFADYCAQIRDTRERTRCYELVDIYEGLRNGRTSICAEQRDVTDRRECYMSFSVQAAKTLKDTSYCEGLSAREQALRALCEHLARPLPLEQPIDPAAHAPQAQRNVMLLGTERGFTEAGESLGVASSFWSWNAKAADFDNDGWQDVYVGNGFHFGDGFYEIQQNILFHNLRGERFTNAAEDWALDDTINTPSYTLIDFDLDGDMDIIATGVLASPRVFENQLNDRRSVVFALEDDIGNRSAIGAKVTIRYGSNAGLRQRKEVKLSSGFMSFDNPTTHFGLGDAEHVDAVTVHWPDGETTEHIGTLPAGHYRVRRLSPQQ